MTDGDFMEWDLLRNGSGYIDQTAYKAIKNCEKEKKEMSFMRGEIFELVKSNSGNMEKALIVSDDSRKENKYLSIIMLQERSYGVYSVPVNTVGGVMYAECDMVSFTSSDRLGEYIKTATGAEMMMVDQCMRESLGLVETMPKETYCECEEVGEPEPEKRTESEAVGVTFEVAEHLEELSAIRTEARIYKDLYYNLLEKMMAK